MKPIKLFEVEFDENENAEIIEKEYFLFKCPKTGQNAYYEVEFDQDGLTENYLYYESKLSENNLFLTKKLANNYIKSCNQKYGYYKKLCFELQDYCNETGFENPFVKIGMNIQKRQNKEFINSIKDCMFKFYAERNLSYYINRQNEFEEELKKEIFKND